MATEWVQMLGEEENIAHVQLIFTFSSTVTEFGWSGFERLQTENFSILSMLGTWTIL